MDVMAPVHAAVMNGSARTVVSVGQHADTAVVLGAGPAGLAAGLALARAGWHVQVYEQAPMVGGLARTVERDGFRFDIGPHRWFTKKDELNAFLIDLLGDELVLVDRNTRIYMDGKYVDYPLRVGNVLGRMGPVTSVRAVGDFVAAQAAQRLSGKPIVSLEDAYVAQFGRTLYELFFRRYSEKVWGKACTELSGDWVTQRSRGLSLLTAVRDAIKRTDGQVESLVDRFMYPARGYGRISERMAAEIEQSGGQVELGWRVVAVEHEGDVITSITVSDGVHERQVEGDAFVSSIPMTEITRILHPAAERGVLAATEELTYRGLVTVHLLLDRPQVISDTWVYVQDPRVRFARMHEPRNWSDAMAPAGKTSLVLEFFCEADDATWQRSDAELCDLAAQDLAEQLHFVEPREVIDGFTVRSRDAYPRYGVGYREAVDAVKAHLGSYENLRIVGRGGTFRYNNTDHAIESGLLAAASLLGEAVDLESVNREAAYLEERRVPTPSTRRTAV
jgi:protoporphyrinogen oxidase